MKNFLIVVVLTIALTSFFGISNNRPVSLQDEDDYSPDDYSVTDTIPAKKDSTVKRKKSKTTPYDSFGKTKKIDTTN